MDEDSLEEDRIYNKKKIKELENIINSYKDLIRNTSVHTSVKKNRCANSCCEFLLFVALLILLYLYFFGAKCNQIK